MVSLSRCPSGSHKGNMEAIATTCPHVLMPTHPCTAMNTSLKSIRRNEGFPLPNLHALSPLMMSTFQSEKKVAENKLPIQFI